jgi:hypothetical protein
MNRIIPHHRPCVPMRRADNLVTVMCRLSWNLGASTSWNPQGLTRPIMGLLFRPCVTISVCNLWYIPSRVKSRRHWIMVSAVMIAPIPNRLSSYWWNHLISPVRIVIAPMAPVSGYGLLFTMWDEWFSCIDINWQRLSVGLGVHRQSL